MAAPHMVDLRALLPEDLIWQPRILILLSLHACILIFPHVDADEAQHPKGKPDDVSSEAQGPSHNHDRNENAHGHALKIHHVLIRPKVRAREAQGPLVLSNAHWYGSNSLT